MKNISVSRYKRNDYTIPNQIPRENTKLRKTFDLFCNNKGLVVDIKLANMQKRQLEDYYGLDIRRMDKNKWVLAGEWFDIKYVDYIAQNLEG